MGVTRAVQGLLNNIPVVSGCPGQQSPSERLALVLCLVPDADVRGRAAHPPEQGEGTGAPASSRAALARGTSSPELPVLALMHPQAFIFFPTLPSHGVISPAWGSLWIQDNQLSVLLVGDPAWLCTGG